MFMLRSTHNRILTEKVKDLRLSIERLTWDLEYANRNIATLKALAPKSVNNVAPIKRTFYAVQDSSPTPRKEDTTDDTVLAAFAVGALVGGILSRSSSDLSNDNTPSSGSSDYSSGGGGGDFGGDGGG